MPELPNLSKLESSAILGNGLGAVKPNSQRFREHLHGCSKVRDLLSGHESANRGNSGYSSRGHLGHVVDGHSAHRHDAAAANRLHDLAESGQP